MGQIVLLNRVVVTWSGAPVVGGGVNVLYFAGDVGPPDPAGIVTAYENLLPALPPTIDITVPGSGDVIEDTNGVLDSVWAAAGGDTITGTSVTTTVAGGAGGCVGWQTGGIIAGRRLRGRTFIVPIVTSEYDTDGTLGPGTVGALNAFATDLMASGPLAVWHRPTTPGGTDGNSYGVVSARVRDKVAILRSRRD